MKRLLLLLVALPVLWFVGSAVLRGFASDETQIRWRIEAMRDGYNSGDLGDVLIALDREWTHERSRLDRELIKGGLLREFFQDRHPKTKELLRRVRFDESSFDVQVSGDRAQLELVVTSSRWKGDDRWEDVWEARISADLRRGDSGWKILRSRHENLHGTHRDR